MYHQKIILEALQFAGLFYFAILIQYDIILTNTKVDFVPDSNKELLKGIIYV